MRRSFVESRGFSANRDRLERAGEITLEDIVALEQDILANPEIGDLVPGTRGLRKVRFGQRQVRRGKRGGLRVYHLDLAASKVSTWSQSSARGRRPICRRRSARRSLLSFAR